MSKERDYQKEYLQESRQRRAARAARNRIRYKLESEGRVKPGDGKHVHHKDHDPLNNNPDNVRVRDATANMKDNQKPTTPTPTTPTPTKTTTPTQSFFSGRKFAE